jgi:hypothetical protein
VPDFGVQGSWIIMALDHTMVQGDTVSLDFAIVDDAGAVVDLTSATIRWQMARSVYAEPDLEKSIGDGITVTDDEGGLFTVLLDDVDTIDLAGTFYYEVEIIDGGGNVSTPKTGTISILPGLISPEVP